MKFIYSFCIICRQISHLSLVWTYLLGFNRGRSCRNRHLEWNRLLFTSTQYLCVIISSDWTRIRNHRCKLDKIRCLRYLCHCLNASYLNPIVLYAWNVFLLWKTAGWRGLNVADSWWCLRTLILPKVLSHVTISLLLFTDVGRLSSTSNIWFIGCGPWDFFTFSIISLFAIIGC